MLVTAAKDEVMCIAVGDVAVELMDNIEDVASEVDTAHSKIV